MREPQKITVEELKARDNFGDLGVHGRIILKCM
jgi:hypothetical protein